MHLRLTLLRDLASLSDLSRIVIPSDRIHSPKACLCSPSFFLEPLPPEFLNHPFSLIVVNILSKVAKLRVA